MLSRHVRLIADHGGRDFFSPVRITPSPCNGTGCRTPPPTASYLFFPPSTTPLGLDGSRPSAGPLEIEDRDRLADGRAERVLREAAPDVRNALSVSSIEDLALGRCTPQWYRAVKEQMPAKLHSEMAGIHPNRR
jgi:hypothetical protein